MYSEAIKKARQEAGLSLAQFGDRIGVTKQCVFNWESGKSKPNDEQRLNLHNEFGIDYSVYFGN